MSSVSVSPPTSFFEALNRKRNIERIINGILTATILEKYNIKMTSTKQIETAWMVL